MWDPRAVIVLILAASIALGHVVATVTMSLQGRPISDVGGDVLTAILGAIIAIVAAYVGKHSNGAPSKPAAKEEGDNAKQENRGPVALEQHPEGPDRSEK